MRALVINFWVVLYKISRCGFLLSGLRSIGHRRCVTHLYCMTLWIFDCVMCLARKEANGISVNVILMSKCQYKSIRLQLRRSYPFVVLNV